MPNIELSIYKVPVVKILANPSDKAKSIVNKEKYTTIDDEYKKHTIYIYTKDRKFANFGISKEEKIKMINSGFSACEIFFNK